LDRIVPFLFSQVTREPRLARVVPLPSAMCGYSNSNWMFSLTMVLTFAVLMVASIVFLVRSFNQKPEKRDDEKP
jgi:hypothetical protein